MTDPEHIIVDALVLLRALTARAEAAEKYGLAMEQRERDLEERAEAAEKRIKEMEQAICGGTFTSAVHRAMARYHIETADRLDRAALEAKL